MAHVMMENPPRHAQQTAPVGMVSAIRLNPSTRALPTANVGTPSAMMARPLCPVHKTVNAAMGHVMREKLFLHARPTAPAETVYATRLKPPHHVLVTVAARVLMFVFFKIARLNYNSAHRTSLA